MLSWLDCLQESVISKDKQVFVLKDSIPKEWTLLMICSSLSDSYTYQISQSRIHTQPTIQWIFTKENKTDELVKQEQKFPDRYFNEKIDDKEIICYAASGANQDTQ